MRDSRQWPAPWLFGLLTLPLGVYVGFIWTALPLLLSQAGLTIRQIARINALLQVPPILLFLWTPVVDVKLRRRTWLVLGASATALLFWIACQFGTLHVKLFTALLFFAGVVVALVSSFSIVGLELVLSQRLQLVLGYSPLQAALFVLPGSLLAFIGGPLAGWSAPRYGTGQVMAGALLLGGLAVAGLFLAADAGPMPQLLSLSVFGLGLGASIAVASKSWKPP